MVWVYQTTPVNTNLLTRLSALLVFGSFSTLRAEIVINEIMFHSPHGENAPEPVGEEYLELHNTGSAAVSLEGWQLDAGVSFAFPAVSIPAGGFVIVAADPVIFATKYPSVSETVMGPWVGRLSNSGEKIRLRDQLGVEVDELTYSDQGDWAVRRRGALDQGHRGWVWESVADGGGGSLELVTPSLSNRRGQNWVSTASGAETPGEENGAFAADPAPMILEVQHSPAVPTDADQITVTADLSDLAGDSLSAVLSYGTASNSSDDRTEVVMSDDALNGDGDAGDGIFGVTLPAFPDGTVVDFYISASDGTTPRTWPGPTDESGTQGANALIQVEATPAVSDQGLPIYRVILSPDEEAEFAHNNFDTDSNAQMNATFIAQIGDDFDVRYLAGIRRRGAGSRDDNPRTMRLNLAADRPWQETTQMNLNAQFNYLQLFGQKIFAASRLPSAKARAIELFFNGDDEAVPTERLYGAYVHLEPQGGDSVARQFPNDPNGNLYSKRRPDSQLAHRDGDIGDYLDDGWEKKTNNADADWSDLDLWLAAVQDTENPNYLTNLEAVMDVDQWLRWFGVMTLLTNGETNPSSGTDDDYYVYSGQVDPRIKAIPHDLDTILGLGDGSAITNPQHTIYDMIEDDDTLDVLIPFMSHPQVLQKYHQVLLELIEGPFSKAKFDALLNGCLAERLPTGVLGGMISFMDARRDYVLSEVNPELTVTTSLPVDGGFPKATSADASFSGAVSLAETSVVKVNGREAVIDSLAGTWSYNSQDLVETSIVSPGTSWRYLDDGSDQGMVWRNTSFDDSGWSLGDGEFGYGDGDETTTLSFGVDPDDKHITTYFRKEITITDPTQFQDFLIRLKRDDGAAVYVNGVLQVLDNLPSDPTFDTLATDAAGPQDEQTFFDFTVPVSAFVAGQNVIAVEVHNVAADNVDLTFDLGLVGRQAPPSEDLLFPGMNRLIVEAFDSEGELLETTSIEVWYDDGDTGSLSGILAADTILTAAGGPYLVDSDLIVPVGVTLTIEPGASLFFGQGVRVTVNGKLDAQGTAHERIQFTVAPGSGETWDGLVFANTDEDNRMSNLDQNFSTAASYSIDVTNARLTLDQVRWRGTTETVLEVRDPKMNVLNCDFPSSSGNEVIHGTSLGGDEFFNLIGNVFQTSSGYNDIIDFSGGRRPGPIIYVLNNVFQGGTDDCLDLDGIDAHVEGNTFLNIHTDDPNRSSTSNAIATDGDAHITIVRNIFDDVDHALLLKNEADAIFENNVVRKATLGAISFREPLRSNVDAGSDVFCRANIFIDCAVVFRSPDHPRAGGELPNIEANGNIMPAAEHLYGANNLDVDPSFVDPDGLDFRLQPGSPAIGTGINGSDMGAMIPRGATISGEPPSLTDLTGAVLTVHMPGISGIESGSFTTEYRWRLNGGPWSADTDIALPITLTGLATGEYQVEVLGKDSNAIWQEEPTISQSWTVTTALPPVVRINELVADSSTGVDWVEFYNGGSAAFDLSGFMISDDPTGTMGTSLPLGTEVPAKGYLKVDLGVDFSLDRDGESFFLFNGGMLVDSVEFGSQLTDHSLSRLGSEGEWGLGLPTPSAANVSVGVGDARLIKINEWTANSGIVICEDFVELYNPGNSPVDLGGFYLSENPGGEVAQFAIPALTFVDGGGFLVLDFAMSSDSRHVALYTDQLEEIDLVAFTSQVEDTSYVRLPDGSGNISVAILPTPGQSNGSSEGTITTTDFSLITLDGTWSYDDSGTDLGAGWRAVAFDDSAWATGGGLIGFETGSLPAPGIVTELTDPDDNDPFIPTYYFRTEFTFTGDPALSELFIQTVIDDGVVIYLNGQPLYRQGIAENPTYNTFADFSGDATLQGPFMVPAGALVSGTNVLAAELHQTNSGSSDFVFGMSLDAVESVFTPADDAEYLAAVDLMNNLRITEVMFDPAEGTAFEFIELQNIGTTSLELEGVRFVEGIQFVFPQMTLAPGEFVILVNDQVSFESKYGAGFPIVGEYEGKLSNGGEEVALQLPAPFIGNIQKFTYNDSWYPISDGGGASLEFIDPSAPVRKWNDRFEWQAGPINGSPGSGLSVSAGNHQTILISASASLNGVVSGGWTPMILWEQIAGPGAAVISDVTAASPSVSFPAPGTYRFRLTASEGGTLLTGETTVAVDDTYPDWALRNTLTTGVSEDEDGDGIVNLLEYALNLDPNQSDRPTLYRISDGQFRYTRYLRKSDLTYAIEDSPDLEDWEERTETILSTTPDEQERVYALPQSGVRNFVRLKVTR